MSSIDRRVVEMEFDNKQFENGVKDTLASLEALKQGLKLEGATKGLQDINAAGQGVDLSGIASGVENISSKFSALGVIGFTVIQNLTTSAMDYARKISGLVLDPLVAGGRRRAENIEQAKFQFRGLGVDVEKAMADALYGVKDTAYGLDAAAKAASQLSASQVTLGEDMQAALRGISGVAAMTNSSYEDTAQVFTRVAGQGRLMGNDLNSLASRGLNAAATLADAFGVTEAEIREMVTKGEISFDMFSKAMNDAFGENATKANETYAGSLSNLRAALGRIGAGFFTPFLEQQRDLFNALTPAVDAVGEALKPVIDMMLRVSGARNQGIANFIGGLQLDKLPLLINPVLRIIENLYTGLISVLGPLRDAFQQIFPPASLMEIRLILMAIEDFTRTLKMGAEGGENLRRTFAGVFAIFSIGWSILKEVAKFFFDIFGIVAEGSGGFLEVTANIGDFLVALDLAIKNGEGLTNFFAGLRDVLEGPIRFIKNLASALLSLFDFDPPSAGVLTDAFEPMGRLGEILLNIWDRVIASWKRVGETFKPVKDFLVGIFGDTIDSIMGAFSDLDFDQIIDILNTGLLGSLLVVFRTISRDLGSGMGSAIHQLTSPFARLTWTLQTMQTTLRAMTLMQIAIAVGILAASVVALSKVDGPGLAKALGAISVMMTQLVLMVKGLSLIGGTSGLIGVGAGLILLAVALRILTSSVKALAELDMEGLTKGLSGVVILIGALILAVQGMSGQSVDMIKAGAGLLLLAFGIKVLASAVTDLSGLSWEEMAKGLVGVGTLLGALAIFTRLVDANKGGLAQGAGLLLLAAGVWVLADAVSTFAELSWEEIAKGLTAVVAILAAFAIFSRTVGDPKSLMASGAALVLVGIAMKILASAMGDFAQYSWEEIAKGLVSMAVALAAISIAINTMPATSVGAAASIAIVAGSLILIANAMEQVGDMSWSELAGAVMGLGAMLGLIVIAMNAMTTALPGAAATLVVAAALAILAPVLLKFADMSMGEMARGLGMLAAVFIVLGVAGLVLAPVVPVLIGLGIAVGLLGIGLMAAGAGIFLFAAGLTALAAAAAAGSAALVAMLSAIISLFPMLAEQLGLALIVFIEVVATAGPAMLEAMTAILQAVIGAIEDNSPDIINMIGDMALDLVEKLRDIIPPMVEAALDLMIGILEAMNEKVPVIVGLMIKLMIAILEEITKRIPEMAAASTALLVAFLNSVADNLGDVITAGADIIIALIEGISDNMVRIVEAGIEAIISFINGVAEAIRDNTDALNAAGGNLASAIISGLTGGLTGAVSRVASAARGLASSAIEAAKGIFKSNSPSLVFMRIGDDVGSGLVIGIDNTADIVKKSAESLGKGAVDAMRESIAGLSEALAVDTDMNPTITPVLDLSEFRKDAASLNAAIPEPHISVDLAYSQAKNASTGYQANVDTPNTTSTEDDIYSPAGITYNQYNTSPKALSSAEIYRQTKNQLSVTKGALTPNAAESA